MENRFYGLYICGGTGEGLLMDVAERKLVAEIVKDEAKGNVKIIVKVIANIKENLKELR